MANGYDRSDDGRDLLADEDIAPCVSVALGPREWMSWPLAKLALRVVGLNSEACANMIAAFAPIVASKGMHPEAIRAARIEADAQAAVGRAMSRTGG
jgi:hypothetical protein